ncbi:MAG: outer membrane protein transport protein [Candidatus Aminicenantes bacterium]|nr:outer membrane protein transport protein [Candidatus Aminicenantes bacterium]
MKKGSLLLSIILLTVFVSSSVNANGLYLNSLGSRAVSMGGAFVGLADDFSAGFWNPAAASQLDWTTAGIYAAYYIPSSSYENGAADISTEYAKSYPAVLGSVFFSAGERIDIGLSFYTLSRFQVEWSGSAIDAITSDPESRDWSTKVWVMTFAPSITYKMSDEFSLGLALNLNYGSYDLFMYKGFVEVELELGVNDLYIGAYSDSGNGVGIGATLGLFFKPSEMFSLGVSIRTPSKMTFQGRSSSTNFQVLDNATDSKTFLTLPLWVAGGIAIKPSQALTLSADVHFSQWSTVETIRTEYDSQVWQVVFQQSGTDFLPMYWEDTIQIRFGVEYRINKVALRAGFYTDPSPVPDKTMNFHFPIVDANYMTFGLEYDGRGPSLHGFQVDLGFEYGMGKERIIDLANVGTSPEYGGAVPGSYKTDMISFNFSFRYTF